MPSPWKRSLAKALMALAVAVLATAGLPAASADEVPAGQAMAAAPQLQADEAMQEVLALTNQERAKHGLPALTLDPALCASALAHGQDMASHDFFSHTGSDGSTVDVRIAAAGYDPLWAYGENIAAGQLTPQEVVNAWMNSEGHRANILSPYYEDIGVSYVYQPGTTYLYYWTQDFASHVAIEVEPTAEPPQPTEAPRPTAAPAQPAPPPSPTPRPSPRPTVTPTPTRVVPTPTPTDTGPTYMGIALAATAAPALPALATDSHVAPTAAPDRARRVVELLNQARADAGRPALSLDAALGDCAQAHSADMAGHDLFSHAGSDGSTAEARIKAAGFESALAESIGGGQATAEEVVDAWLADPALRDQILSADICCAGVGYAYGEGSSFRHYWTLDVAARGPAAQAGGEGPLGWLRRSLAGLLQWLGLSEAG